MLERMRAGCGACCATTPPVARIKGTKRFRGVSDKTLVKWFPKGDIGIPAKLFDGIAFSEPRTRSCLR